MIISFNKVFLDIPGFVEGTTLERADTVKPIGVPLSHDLSWGHHVEFIVIKAQCICFV